MVNARSQPLNALVHNLPGLWAGCGERSHNCSPATKTPQCMVARSPLRPVGGTGTPLKSPASNSAKKTQSSALKDGVLVAFDDSDEGHGEPEEVLSGNKQRGGTVGWKILALVVLAGLSLRICLFHLDYRPGATSADDVPLLRFRHLARGPQRGFFTRHPGCPDLPARPVSSALNWSYVPRHYPRPVNYSRGECACTPVHNFVILSMQRSGSGWFETLLNNHPNVSSHGEVFSVRPRRQNFAAIAATLARVYNLDWHSSAAKEGECTAAVGLKWMLNQGAMEYHKEVRALFEARHVSVVLLFRRNVLRRLVSILANAHDRRTQRALGMHKSHVHSRSEAKALARFQPVINVKHLKGNLERVQQIADDALRAFNGTRLRVVYYEDVVRSREVLNEVQDFLGVPRRPLESLQVKIHTRPLKETVRNWEEVQQKLKGTEFESFTFEGDYIS